MGGRRYVADEDLRPVKRNEASLLSVVHEVQVSKHQCMFRVKRKIPLTAPMKDARDEDLTKASAARRWTALKVSIGLTWSVHIHRHDGSP